MEGKIIGKVSATEKNPSTTEDFFFWTSRQKSSAHLISSKLSRYLIKKDSVLHML